MDMTWITWIIQGVTGLAIGAIGFFIKQYMGQIQSSIKKESDRITALEDKLNTTIQALPYQYTLREDHIRATAALDKKMDKVIDLIHELKRQQ